MDLFEQWHKIEEEKFINQPIKKEAIMEAIYQKSTGTMETLKTRLKYKMAWVLFFAGVSAGLLLWQINNLTLVAIFGIVAVFYSIGFLGLRKYYKRMGTDRGQWSTIEVMKNNYKLITNALKFESQMMVPVLPIMLIAGMVVPRIMDGDSLALITSEPKFLIAMLIGVIVLTPLFKILGDRMNKFAYGSYINKLEENIKEMEKVG